MMPVRKQILERLLEEWLAHGDRPVGGYEMTGEITRQILHDLKIMEKNGLIRPSLGGYVITADGIRALARSAAIRGAAT